MSEKSEDLVEESLLEESSLEESLLEVKKEPVKKEPIKKEKNPNRVRQGLKLAAIGQKAKEKKLRRKVKEEMVKPKTWVLVGVVISSLGFLGLYFSPLFSSKEKEVIEVVTPPKPEKEKKSYFG